MNLLPNISGFFPEGFHTRLHLPAAAWYEVDQATGEMEPSIRHNSRPKRLHPPHGGGDMAARENKGLVFGGCTGMGRQQKTEKQHTGYLGVFDVRAGEEIEVKAYINEHELAPILRGWVTWKIRRNANDQPRLLEQNFKGPWYGIYRRLGAKNISEEAKGKPVVRFDFI